LRIRADVGEEIGGAFDECIRVSINAGFVSTASKTGGGQGITGNFIGHKKVTVDHKPVVR
jgi:hypothetical protein